MKNVKIFIITLISGVLFFGCQQGLKQSFSGDLENEVDSASYALGVNIGQSLTQSFDDLDPAIIAKAINDVYSENDLMIAEDTVMNVIRTYQSQKQAKAQEENLQKSQNFLKKNLEKEGIKELPSGVQYNVLKEGSGRTPNADDTVVVHYVGTLTDGTEFANSRNQGKPFTSPVNGQFIEGWKRVLPKMKLGAKWKVFIPPELGYGERGHPRSSQIGPNEVLIFEMELIDIK